MAELDTLRTAYRDSGPDGDGAHLSEDRWELLACDELTSEERRAAFDHILGCALCSDTHRALQTLRSEAAAFDPGAPTPDDRAPEKLFTRRGLWGGLGFLALAASLVMVVVLPISTPEKPDTETRAHVLRSAEAPSPATPVAPVDQTVEWRSRDELLLRWTPRESAVPAVVEILNADGELIWTSPETTRAEIGWPIDVARDPGRYYWRVVVTGSGGGKVPSELVSFELVDEVVTTSPP